MALSPERVFGILITEDIDEILVGRRDTSFCGETDVFSRLPDEIVDLILSNLITGDIYLYQAGCPYTLHAAAYLRQVCRRFRNLIDGLMFITPLRHIRLIGGISGDYTEMTTVYREYRNSL
ncbi:uncharacterized protein A1O5_03098 [Cladophialophora psammophila CBS 110553]|uniref:F-box domain-containing protein n=1 Tax=Cladophialophora psammophila CBS 110553 TaxID=1182543 RepID=W9WZK0_9EURO|nr:uncharacterized protein A1O5_03098 [Cladophialophora psammophila CBS 110553]EXJ73338.1 hypothetical protein A1O5_03098 [Cladophialophora psammophila CBS 110553]